jgi:hypothetical protein
MKTQFFTYLVLPVVLLCNVSATAAGELTPPGYEWGTLLEKVKGTTPAGNEIIQFTPGEKPKYKNRILNYITAIDTKLRDKIIILKVKSQPEIDYLFVNNKLYSIMENWGQIDKKTEKEIQSNLSKQFGSPFLQQDKNFYIYSFSSDKTKVLWYLIKLPEGASSCKVYYYTKQLFRMLIAE